MAPEKTKRDWEVSCQVAREARVGRSHSSSLSKAGRTLEPGGLTPASGGVTWHWHVYADGGFSRSSLDTAHLGRLDGDG